MKIFLQILTLLTVLPVYASQIEIDKEPENNFLPLSQFEHIKFGRIPSNKITISDDGVRTEVNESSSFLMYAFDEVKTVNKISVKWNNNGKPKIKNAEHETLRDGDDAVVKVGLLLLAEEDVSTPFFLPSWMKQVHSKLKNPSDLIIYTVADSKHNSGESWINPYNDRVTMISMQNKKIDAEWYQSEIELQKPVKVVAVWLMSDGDNTKSSFVTTVKDILLR